MSLKAVQDKHPTGTRCCATVVVVLLAVLSSAADASAQGVPSLVLLAHRDAGITNLTSAELGRVYLSQTGEIAGKTVKAINLADEAARFAFLERVTGMSRRDLEKHFVAQELRGENGWPSEVPDAEALIKLMLQSKKAIGWLAVSDFTALPERVSAVLTVVNIDGKSPAGAGYRLSP